MKQRHNECDDLALPPTNRTVFTLLAANLSSLQQKVRIFICLNPIEFPAKAQPAMKMGGSLLFIGGH